MDVKIKKRIGIVGSGPCGIVSGKTALECGFDVVLFEKNESIGGVWSVGTGAKAWDNMETHISYVSMMFSDYFWNVPEEKKPFYPTREGMFQYFTDYCNHFNLFKNIKLKTKVIEVVQLKQEKKWLIKWCNIGCDENNIENIKHDIFDFVIISTGLFCKKKDINVLKQLKKFNGRISTSEQYKNPSLFIDKRVLVIGGSSSGIEIASDISNAAKSVYVSCKRNRFIFKRRFPNNKENLPIFDQCTQNRERENKVMGDIESNIFKSNLFNLMSENQKESQYFKVTTPNHHSQYFIKSNNFIELLEGGRIKVIDKVLTSCSGNKVILTKNNNDNDNNDSMTTIEVDEIICCDGYDVDLSFFDDDIKKIISFDNSYPHMPVLLHKHIFSPDLDNIAFIGFYRSPTMIEMEIQARYSIYCFANIINLPSRETMLKGMKDEEEVRILNDNLNRPQFAVRSFVRYCDEIAKEIGCLPDFNQFKLSDPEFHNIIYTKMFHPSTYRLNGPFPNEKDSIFHIKNDYNHYYNNNL